MDITQRIMDLITWASGRVSHCVAEPGACVSTVQFWVAVGTGIGLILGVVRWGLRKARKVTVEDRLRRIESKVVGDASRSSSDSELVRAHRALFSRPAFTTSCVQEISILLLMDAVDETLTALSTGRLYDRKGLLRGVFDTMFGYRSDASRKVARAIFDALQDLKVELRSLEGLLRACPVAMYPPREFLSGGLQKRTDAATWQAILAQCDRVDVGRNKVIALFNQILAGSKEVPLRSIALSSELVPRTTAS
jgi:hypothetical protein